MDDCRWVGEVRFVGSLQENRHICWYRQQRYICTSFLLLSDPYSDHLIVGYNNDNYCDDINHIKHFYYELNQDIYIHKIKK